MSTALSPTAASSPTLIVTPFPKAASHRRALPQLQLPPPTINGFLQPHRNNLPRRQIKSKKQPQPPPCSSSSSSSASSTHVTKQTHNILKSTWAQASCLQEISRGSRVFVAFSHEEPQTQSIPCERLSKVIPDHPSLLGISPPSSRPDCSSIQEERTSCDNNPLNHQRPPPARCLPDSLHPDLSPFTAIIHTFNIKSSPIPKTLNTPKPTHSISLSAHGRDDGTPNLTAEQFIEARTFFHTFIAPSTSPASKPHMSGDRPHPRHGTASTTKTEPAPSQPHTNDPKILILASRSHAVDALSLGVGLAVCHPGLGRTWTQHQEDTDVDVDVSSLELDHPDRDTPVHALFMRLHDFDPDDDDGLQDEWRGAVSRSGMDVVWGCVRRD